MSESFWCSFTKPEQQPTTLTTREKLQYIIEDKPIPNPLRQWGHYDFIFNFQAQGGGMEN